MDGEHRSTDNSIISLPDDQNSTGQRDDASTNVDATAYVDALVYGDVPLPLAISFAKAAGIEAQANAAQKLEGSERFSIGNPGGGSLGVKSEDARREQADENTRDSIIAAFEAERERQREAWAQEMHSFGGVEMTGAEWGTLGRELKQHGPLHQWLVERLMKDGKSRAQAERKADEIADVAEIMGKPKSEWTAAERDKVDRADRDPEIRKVMPDLEQQRLNGPDSLHRQDIAQKGQRVSVDGGADLFESAPALTAHHQNALAATLPLDAPPAMANAVTAPKPVLIPAASAGLDL